jgi:hypothetical protein
MVVPQVGTTNAMHSRAAFHYTPADTLIGGSHHNPKDLY